MVTNLSRVICFPSIFLTIKQNGLDILNNEYNPIETSRQRNYSSRRVKNRIKMRFQGRLDMIDLEIGEYEIIIETFFDDKLIQLNKYIFYVQ